LQVTTDELLQLIGAKEAELFILRRQIAALQSQLPQLAKAPTTESPKD
jgi:hypothetical protein